MMWEMVKANKWLVFAQIAIMLLFIAGGAWLVLQVAHIISGN